jgi:hypothetical protein
MDDGLGIGVSVKQSGGITEQERTPNSLLLNFIDALSLSAETVKVLIRQATSIFRVPSSSIRLLFSGRFIMWRRRRDSSR